VFLNNGRLEVFKIQIFKHMRVQSPPERHPAKCGCDSLNDCGEMAQFAILDEKNYLEVGLPMGFRLDERPLLNLNRSHEL